MRFGQIICVGGAFIVLTDPDSQGALMALVSELELGWPGLFLRAVDAASTRAIASALVPHLAAPQRAIAERGPCGAAC